MSHSEGDHAALLDDGADAALESRLFRSMCLTVVVVVISSALLAPWRVTTGLLVGGLLSLLNYHWLSSSVSAVFSGASVTGKRPKVKATRFILRYVVVAAVIYIAYKLNLVSLVATIAGMCTFVVALFVEAFTQFYQSICREGD